MLKCYFAKIDTVMENLICIVVLYTVHMHVGYCLINLNKETNTDS